MSVGFVSHYWRGEGRLWVVFWIYGVLASALLTAIVLAATLNNWITAVWVLVALLLGVAYTVWVLVSVWRCAPNINDEPLGIPKDTLTALARWLTTAWAINIVGLSAMLLQSTISR